MCTTYPGNGGNIVGTAAGSMGQSISPANELPETWLLLAEPSGHCAAPLCCLSGQGHITCLVGTMVALLGIFSFHFQGFGV